MAWRPLGLSPSTRYSDRIPPPGEARLMDWKQLALQAQDLVMDFPWVWVFSALHILLWISAVLHALLYKRDPRAALGWIGVSLLFPLFGPFLYYLFGINRIVLSARQYEETQQPIAIGYEVGRRGSRTANPVVPADPALLPFVNITDRVGSLPITAGNRIGMLVEGAAAYAAMLRAVAAARDYIVITTYIFETDEVGREFIESLALAVERGVVVRVILDGIGASYNWPRARRLLRRRGIQVTRFLPPRLLPPQFHINLRNHRKIFAVDGEVGFTGGMNIGGRYLVDHQAGTGTSDLHFQVRGPVVEQLLQVFAEDWHFCTGEKLELACATAPPGGDALARCIRDGPTDDMDKISLTMMGAIAAARERVILVTPYFLPPKAIVSTLQAAALQGVDVNVLVPEKSNLRYVDWASRNTILELLQQGVKIRYQPPPFAHTKLQIVDGCYAQVGSANIDPRSLRLNFELNLEVMSAATIAELTGYVEQRLRLCRDVTLEEIQNRSLPARVRDAFCWLFSPYL